jgi:hypothetical protein
VENCTNKDMLNASISINSDKYFIGFLAKDSSKSYLVSPPLTMTNLVSLEWESTEKYINHKNFSVSKDSFRDPRRLVLSVQKDNSVTQRWLMDKPSEYEWRPEMARIPYEKPSL